VQQYSVVARIESYVDEIEALFCRVFCVGGVRRGSFMCARQQCDGPMRNPGLREVLSRVERRYLTSPTSQVTMALAWIARGARFQFQLFEPSEYKELRPRAREARRNLRAVSKRLVSRCGFDCAGGAAEKLGSELHIIEAIEGKSRTNVAVEINSRWRDPIDGDGFGVARARRSRRRLYTRDVQHPVDRAVVDAGVGNKVTVYKRKSAEIAILFGSAKARDQAHLDLRNSADGEKRSIATANLFLDTDDHLFTDKKYQEASADPEKAITKCASCLVNRGTAGRGNRAAAIWKCPWGRSCDKTFGAGSVQKYSLQDNRLNLTLPSISPQGKRSGFRCDANI